MRVPSRLPAGLELGDLAWAAAGLGAGGPVALAAAGVWVGRSAAPHLYDDPGRVPARRTAIVPGARVHPDGRPFPVLVDRLEAALGLLSAGPVERILVSGCAHRDGTHDEPAGMVRWLVGRGVPTHRIDVDRAGYRTLSTMVRAAEMGVREAVVCTQRFHLARSVFLARHAGIDAVGLAADRRMYRRRHKDAAREIFARYRAVTDVLRRRASPGRP